MTLTPISINKINKISALVIGASGIGKTMLIRTIAETERVIVLSAESGLLCIRDLVISGKIKGFEINSIAEINLAFKKLKAFTPKETTWIFIDSLTEIADQCLFELKKKYAKSDAFKMWGEQLDIMKDMVKDFRDLEHYNVVFTCLETIEKDEVGKRFFAPSIPGSLKNLLVSYFDFVFYMVIKPDKDGNPTRYFITQNINGKYPSKDRSTKLATIEIADLAYIKNKVLGD